MEPAAGTARSSRWGSGLRQLERGLVGDLGRAGFVPAGFTQRVCLFPPGLVPSR